MSRHWVDIGEVASRFGVSEKTVRRWIKDESLGIAAELRQGRWFINLDTIRHRSEALAMDPDPDLVTQLRADLEKEKQRADAALHRAGVLEGLLKGQEKRLIEYRQVEEELAEVREELANRDRAGLLARIFRRW